MGNVIVWLTGLSGAGKSTIAEHLVRTWRRHNPQVVLLDGDEMRRVFGSDGQGDYSVEARRRNAERVQALCALLDRQRIDVVCATLSLFQDLRDENRETFSNYLEAWVSTPLEVCMQRDRKQLYETALRGLREDVVGVDIPYDAPERHDVELDNGAPGADARALARQLWQQVRIRKALETPAGNHSSLEASSRS